MQVESILSVLRRLLQQQPEAPNQPEDPFVPGAAEMQELPPTQLGIPAPPVAGSSGGTFPTQYPQISNCLSSTDLAAGAGGLWK